MNTGKKKEDNLSSSAIKSGIGNLLSRISGFIRDVLLANYFGTGGIISAFLTAFTFPNMARRIFGEGALTASFIPMLSDALKNDKEDEWHFASVILSIATILTTVLSIIAIFICLIGSTLAEGQTQNIFVLSAWLMPFMVFICLSDFFLAYLTY
jgi:putative peptidoglycan lipid II flippase